MKTSFVYDEPQINGASTKVYFEQVFAEKPAGGLVANPAFDIEPSTAVGKGNDGLYHPIKAYRLVNAVAQADTSIRIAKGSGVAKNDIIAHGSVGKKCTAVDTSNAEYDTVTVTLGVAVANGTVLYQSGVESAAAAGDTPAVLPSPIYTPAFVVGDVVPAGKGDARVRLVNGANLRKATANVAQEVVDAMPQITLV